MYVPGNIGSNVSREMVAVVGAKPRISLPTHTRHPRRYINHRNTIYLLHETYTNFQYHHLLPTLINTL